MAVAEDMVQDVFVNIWIKRAELHLDNNLLPYLYRAVRNASIQYLRHQQIAEQYNVQVYAKLREAELIPSSWMCLAHDLIEEKEIQALYETAIHALPEKTRDIFLLSRKQGMKNSEIAKHVNLSIKSVEYHISSALKTFRIVFKDYLWILILMNVHYFT
jgi:RNA polymerase sigma-70 factor (ECF subfamily)